MMIFNKGKKLLYLFLVVLGVLLPAVCVGQGRILDGRLVGTEKLGDARMLALGGALRASSSNTSAVYMNPATMAMDHVYHINVKYQYTGLDNLHNGGVAIMDSITSTTFAGGLSLDYLRNNASNSDFASWDGRLAAAANIRNIFFMGATARYVRAALDIEATSTGPNGVPSLPRNDTVEANGFTLDAGLGVRLGDYFSLGAVGYNLTNPGTLYAPLQLGGGLAVLIKDMWFMELDAVADFSSYDTTGVELQFGTELILQKSFSLRGGYDHDFHFDVNSYCLGFGYTAPRFAIDLGYKQDIEYLSRVRIALGFRIFIG